MTIFDFISKNPDLVTLVVGTIGGLIWKRGKNVKADDLWDTLLQLGRQSFTRLLQDKRLYEDDYVREIITKTIWSGLTRLGVPKSEATLRLVGEAVEHVKGELAIAVMKHHFGRLTTSLEATREKLAP